MLECVEQTLVNNLCTSGELLDEKVLEKCYLNKTQISQGYQKSKPGFRSQNTKPQQQTSKCQHFLFIETESLVIMSEMSQPVLRYRKASQKTNREKYFYICFTVPKFCWRIFHSSRCFLRQRETYSDFRCCVASKLIKLPFTTWEKEGQQVKMPHQEILLQAGAQCLVQPAY